MNKLEIFTLNARDNIILELIERYGHLGYTEINREIFRAFTEFNKILEIKGINYLDLKNALIPHRDKREVVLIFDRPKINSNCYGHEVFNILLPLLDEKSTNSFLEGDYIDVINNQDFLKKILFDELSINSYEGYKESSQFYLIYINNTNDEAIKKIITGFSKFKAFVGLVDISFGSVFKNYISCILVHSFVKSGKYILMDHPDDVDNDTDENKSMYSFEEFGYTVKSLQSLYYCLFLSYKVECDLKIHGMPDINFSICSLTPDVLDVSNMFIKVTDEKIKYLKEEKKGIMKRLEWLSISPKELEDKIKDKLESNYFFNLRICEEDGSYLFSIIVEFVISCKKYKLLIGLKYIFVEKQLFLITLY